MEKDKKEKLFAHCLLGCEIEGVLNKYPKTRLRILSRYLLIRELRKQS